ncbi:mechanosensitive ion channel family protein [Heyndrickxia acidicola]|uniref:Mechanosensitive ion channel family protein n=1 Tax=Heyndrickxia acidicola TaxID=209389 RepID=A0ABU6MF99_9BACI|nr:mechanosensitive ion channel family protein [Heyndrickxia acidicola]MED1202716.1 mechanosensitive ion channel family protein [Heyndrickxia acidicola]
MNIGETALKVFIVIALTSVVVKIGKAALHNIFKIRSKAPLQLSERREKTLLRLLENVLTYVVYFISLVTILSLMSIDVKGLLAGAGIIGLAVGFGAQSLVKDIISGFFIIFEDQFSVGDYVGIGNFLGTVEQIGLRTTKILSWTGEVHIIPNGHITEVTNYSMHNSVGVVDIHIPYEEDIKKAEAVIQEMLIPYAEEYEEITKAPELLGVNELGTSYITLRVVVETLPMSHWSIARKLRKSIKMALDENGIKAPYPKLVMYSRNGEKQMEEEKEFQRGV